MENRTSFTFDGKDSRDFHLYIENNVSFPSPETDIDFVEVLGRDGDLAINNNRLKGVDFSLPVIVKPPNQMRLDDLAMDISGWLKKDIGWKKLRIGENSEYEYIAMANSSFDIQRTIMNHGRTVLNFRLKPYKYRKNQQYITLWVNGNNVVYNRENMEAEPLIKVYGSGDINFKNNGEPWLTLRGVERNIVVDTEMQLVYTETYPRRPQYNKMVGATGFPKFHIGENKITWDRTDDSVALEILPRWRSLM